MEPLTEKQKRVLEFIEAYFLKANRSPTFQEIQLHFGYKSLGTVHDFISVLKQKGYLAKESRRWNSLEVNQGPSFSVPLLGKVAAGKPIQHFKYEERVTIPSDMISQGVKHFALQVVGDSMIEEGILENDYVIVRSQSTAYNGQIVVAELDHESTIKSFYKRKGLIELRSANEKYPPILVKSTQLFRIVGVFCGLIRKVRS